MISTDSGVRCARWQPRRRYSRPGSLGFVLLLCVVYTGCSRLHPVLQQPALRQELRTAQPLEPRELVTEAPKKLEEAPIAPATEAITRAKKVTAPDPPLPAVSLALPDVRKTALESNLDLQVTLFNPSIAEAGYQGERWKFEAVLGASILTTRVFDQDGLKAQTTSLVPSVQVPTQAGGTVSLSFPFSRRDSKQINPATAFPGPPQPFGRTDTSGLEVSLSQPLLQGAGFELNYASINRAGLALRQADARTKLFTIRVLANAEQTYWRHYAAHEKLKIQLEQYELALEQVRTAQRLVEEGARTKIEITRTQSDAARRFEGIIVAENLRRQTELALKRTMNASTLPITSPTLLLPTTPPTPQGLNFDRAKVVELALKNRMELFENELQIALDRLTLQVARNRVLPDVRFNFDYAFSHSSPEFDRALGALFNKRFDAYTVGLTASIPAAGNQQARYQALQSALILSQTEANRQALELSIREEVLNAIDAVELSWQRILSNRAAVARAQETYEDNKREFQLGKITSTELLLTLDQLASARSSLVTSLSDYQNALVDLAFATGTVLGQGGVIWTPAEPVKGKS